MTNTTTDRAKHLVCGTCNPQRMQRYYHTAECPNHPANQPSREASVPFPQETRFGPGLMETWRLTSWVTPGHGRMVRLQGTYPVYCGMGNSHEYPLDIRSKLEDVHSLDPHEVATTLAEWAMEEYPGCGCGEEV